MKAVILAGGFGTRISEESQFKPKPMIEIGEMPILWYIMKGYSVYGVNEFVICAGYKQHVIKEWFADYFLHTSDITFDFTKDNEVIVHDKHAEHWKVTVVDTGLNTMTGGRVKRIQKYVCEEPFYLTYGDAVANVNIVELTKFHQKHGKCVTLTTVSIAQQKGVLDIDSQNTIIAFREKDDEDGTLINGGFMVCNPGIFDYLEDDRTVLEQLPMRRLASAGELKSFYHEGFWQCMDTKREKDKLEELWASGIAPWKVWED
ncbi:glucose-1-phosphate cytidylyltransferase [Desulfosporosinus sp. BG]|uniref:glucose-1-phosphate cytidylyltransferase n=1 Tax=Desulfosporosinus sp. BG TaxID=1633135 RepID=UPI000839E381|nr:glucose-1-phosphate cytidylyltransferase [Desulfosporosinus sp. BG]ODA40161.1 Glucose-1-phosphate cytidylyltransferase [Desulfosporosinus sp. BG]